MSRVAIPAEPTMAYQASQPDITGQSSVSRKMPALTKVAECR